MVVALILLLGMVLPIALIALALLFDVALSLWMLFSVGRARLGPALARVAHLRPLGTLSPAR